MSEPTTLADLIGTDPLPTDAVRKCRVCAEVKPFAASHWRTEPNGKPRGWMCKACDSARSSRKARRRSEVAKALRDAAGAERAHGPISGRVKTSVAAQLDSTEALRAGVRKANNIAETGLRTFGDYVADRSSPHHEWALKMLIERIMPAKLFAEMGLAGAGLGDKGGGKQAPNVQIIVQPAQPVAQEVRPAITFRAIEVEDVPTGASDGDEQAG